jgi:hypothetical protein
MTLGEKQRLFTRYLGQLIQWSYSNGYELTFGDAFRPAQQAAANAAAGTGIKNSLHTQRLAVDFNLFIDGVYQNSSIAHKPLGDYWKTLHPSCCWGGDFTRADGNHYSFTHNGVK